MMHRTVRTALVVALVACQRTAAAPTASIPSDPSTLDLVLTTPNTDDGALLVDIAGPGIDSVTAASGDVVFDAASASTAGDRRVIVQGNIAAGAIATVWVHGSDGATSYAATVEQVAVRGTFVQRAVSGYHLSLAARE